MSITLAGNRHKEGYVKGIKRAYSLGRGHALAGLQMTPGYYKRHDHRMSYMSGYDDGRKELEKRKLHETVK